MQAGEEDGRMGVDVDVDVELDAADEDNSAATGTLPPPPPGRTEGVSFATFCDLLEALQEEPRHTRRVEIVRDFRERYLTGRRRFPAAVLQRQQNEERPGGGAGGGPAPGGGGGGAGGEGGGAAARGKSALASLRPGQLRAGVASKRAVLGFLGKRRALPASLVRTAGGGGGGSGGGGGGGGGGAGAGARGMATKTEEQEDADGGGAKEGNGDLFQFYRLLLPSLDDERGRYHLKEKLLAKALCNAVGRGDPKNDSGEFFLFLILEKLFFLWAKEKKQKLTFFLLLLHNSIKTGAERVLKWQTDSSGASAGTLAHVARDELVSACML